jgi:monothiol glutaredoxin
MDIKTKIQNQISESPILLYMKGSPKSPSCGFSAQAVKILIACETTFSHVNILTNPDIRAALPEYADWPTFPQLWVNGELIGGCDILIEMFQNHELQPLLKGAVSRSD